jgi:esterase/lipase
MRNLLVILSVVCLYGCMSVSAEKVNPEINADAELKGLLENLNKTQALNGQAQQAADKKQAQVINQAAATITSLKSEVAALKTELNEVKDSLRIVSDVNNGSEFKIKGSGF